MKSKKISKLKSKHINKHKLRLKMTFCLAYKKECIDSNVTSLKFFLPDIGPLIQDISFNKCMVHVILRLTNTIRQFEKCPLIAEVSTQVFQRVLLRLGQNLVYAPFNKVVTSYGLETEDHYFGFFGTTFVVFRARRVKGRFEIFSYLL